MNVVLNKVAKTLVFRKGSRVFDIGSSDASLSNHLAKRERNVDFYYRPESKQLATDVSNAITKHKINNLRLRSCPSDRLSFKDHTVATIISYLPNRYQDPVALVKEFKRVLIDGGEIVIVGPHPSFGKIIFDRACSVAIEKLPHIIKDQMFTLFAAMKSSFMSYRITDIVDSMKFYSVDDIFRYINQNFDSSYLNDPEVAKLMLRDLTDQIEKFGKVEVATNMRVTKVKHDF